MEGIFEGYYSLLEKNIFVGNMKNPDTILIKNQDVPILNGYGLMDINYCHSFEALSKLKNNSLKDF